MMEERYHATTQNRFYPDMSNVNKNITVEAKLISPPTYIISVCKFLHMYKFLISDSTDCEMMQQYTRNFWLF